MRKLFTVCLCLVLALTAFTPLAEAAYAPDHVRIGLFFKSSAKEEIWLEFDSGFDVGKMENDTFTAAYSSDVNKIRVQKSPDDPTDIWIFDEEGNVLFACYAGTEGAMLMGRVNETGERFVTVEKTRYRGSVEFKRFSNSDMTVINYVAMEDYLKGVVPYEMSASFPLEALKAQAVAARTYASFHQNKYADYGFNLCNTTASQVYRGTSGEYDRTNQAVDETRGLVMTYDGKLTEAFYCASSGGYTESCVNVWVADLPYLTAVPDPYEPLEKNNNYEYTYTASELAERLRSRDADVGEVLSVTAEEVTESGRVKALKIVGTTGEKVFTKEAVRSLLGFPSTKFSIMPMGGTGGNIALPAETLSLMGPKTIAGKVLQIERAKGNEPPTAYLFTGNGNGHGVGMSQNGAVGMANEGFTFDQILSYYYQGITIEQ